MVADIAHNVQAWWAPLLAFAAGLVSFVSPCVLPLVPGYLSFVTGEQAVAARRQRVLPVLLFILGFSVVFTVVFGLTASVIRTWFVSETGHRVAGAVVILFGVFMLLFALRLGFPWLYREERPFLSRVKPGPAGAFPLGMAFAIGWTPCIGPVLAATTALAANEGNTARAVLLLFCYSMGLGVPFLLIGMGIGRLMRVFRFASRNYHWFAGVSGVVLVAIGVLLVTGQWTRLMAPLFQYINRFTPPI